MSLKGKLLQMARQVKNSPAMRKRQADQELSRWTPHDEAMAKLYGEFLSPGDLCFDVGANIGNRTKIFRRLGARVVAVEPQEACAAILKAHFHEGVEFVEEALGETEGETTMYVSNADTITSLSPEWIESVKRSGRFSDYSWNERRTVRLTTLDRLIERYGKPRFLKIDVEGYEFQVLKGLSQPVEALSIELTPERMEKTLECLDHLDTLGHARYNLSINESMRLEKAEWLDRQGIDALLKGLASDTKTFGDVYVRLA